MKPSTVARRVKLTFVFASTALLPLAGCDWFGDAFVDACEDVLKERLKSPSSYKRISTFESSQLLDEREYAEYLTTRGESEAVQEWAMKEFKSGSIKPTNFSILIEYDADNSYGAAIRGYATCTYISDYGRRPEDRKLAKFIVQVDGENSIEWLRQQLQQR